MSYQIGERPDRINSVHYNSCAESSRQQAECHINTSSVMRRQREVLIERRYGRYAVVVSLLVKNRNTWVGQHTRSKKFLQKPKEAEKVMMINSLSFENPDCIPDSEQEPSLLKR